MTDFRQFGNLYALGRLQRLKNVSVAPIPGALSHEK